MHNVSMFQIFIRIVNYQLCLAFSFNENSQTNARDPLVCDIDLSFGIQAAGQYRDYESGKTEKNMYSRKNA